MGKNSQTTATKKPDSDEESGDVNFFRTAQKAFTLLTYWWRYPER
jgi:hypothetical protein